jgi:hypothetical protein
MVARDRDLRSAPMSIVQKNPAQGSGPEVGPPVDLQGADAQISNSAQVYRSAAQTLTFEVGQSPDGSTQLCVRLPGRFPGEGDTMVPVYREEGIAEFLSSKLLQAREIRAERRQLREAQDDRLTAALNDALDDGNQIKNTMLAPKWVTLPNGDLVVVIGLYDVTGLPLGESVDGRVQSRISGGSGGEGDERRGTAGHTDGAVENRSEGAVLAGVTANDVAATAVVGAVGLNGPMQRTPAPTLSEEELKELLFGENPFSMFDFLEALRTISQTLDAGVSREGLAIIQSLAHKYIESVMVHMGLACPIPPPTFDAETFLVVGHEVRDAWNIASANTNFADKAQEILTQYAARRQAEATGSRAAMGQQVEDNSVAEVG